MRWKLTAFYLNVAQLTVHGEVLEVHGTGRRDGQSGKGNGLNVRPASAYVSNLTTTSKAIILW